MDAVNIAVALITNEDNEILITQRPMDVHLGGLWEFPGGKVEQGETIYQALVREIKEELTIDILSAEPFRVVCHDYSDKSVCLHVWNAAFNRKSAQHVLGADKSFAGL